MTLHRGTRERTPLGARLIWRDVLEAGFSCGLRKIERLMRAQALPKDGGERSLRRSRLDRQFMAGQPNRKWIADFTYVWTAEGWLHVAATIDLFSRRVVGWSMKIEMSAQLVTLEQDAHKMRDPATYRSACRARVEKVRAAYAEAGEPISRRDAWGKLQVVRYAVHLESGRLLNLPHVFGKRGKL